MFACKCSSWNQCVLVYYKTLMYARGPLLWCYGHFGDWQPLVALLVMKNIFVFYERKKSQTFYLTTWQNFYFGWATPFNITSLHVNRMWCELVENGTWKCVKHGVLWAKVTEMNDVLYRETQTGLTPPFLPPNLRLASL